MRARGEDPVRDRELQLQSDGAIDGEIAIAISDRDRDLGSRSRRGRWTGNISGIDDFFFFFFFFLGCGLCFLICVFLLLFQTPENIFRKIF